MTFDAATSSQDQPALAEDDHPIVRLIDALRSPLPEGFEWDFTNFETCACGLAATMGILGTVLTAHHSVNSAVFCREEDGIVPLYGVPARDVTPAMVADKLEAIAFGNKIGSADALIERED